MLDFVLVFSLAKLVFDNEVCGQVLQLTKELQVMGDLPTGDLVQAQLAEAHLITAPHTLAHWERALYLPGPTFERKNREAWERDGSPSVWQRAVAEVDARLAAYEPVATELLVDAELRRLVRGGMTVDAPLPIVPAPDVIRTPRASATPSAYPATRATAVSGVLPSIGDTMQKEVVYVLHNHHYPQCADGRHELATHILPDPDRDFRADRPTDFPPFPELPADWLKAIMT